MFSNKNAGWSHGNADSSDKSVDLGNRSRDIDQNKCIDRQDTKKQMGLCTKLRASKFAAQRVVYSAKVHWCNGQNLDQVSLVGGLVAILYFPINIGLMSSSQLTHSYFSEGFKQPPTRISDQSTFFSISLWVEVFPSWDG